MIEHITESLVKESIETSPWDLGNQTLYDLCTNNFTHETEQEIIAKVWLIGRSYSVAVERRRNKIKTDINDSFYIDTIVPTFLKSDLDNKLKELKNVTELNDETIPKVLEAHDYLTKLLKTITALDKRSFSSKYLHFHLPNLFFIYDSRAVIALRKLNLTRTGSATTFHPFDKEYAPFVSKCKVLLKHIRTNYNLQLSPRQLDNLLLQIANKEILNKNLI